MAEMTKKLLREICKKDQMYSTPEYNDKLFLHYKGFAEIANLEEYTGLRALWLEGNGLTRITGLEQLHELRTLYLQENSIETIEGLEGCVSLPPPPREGDYRPRTHWQTHCATIHRMLPVPCRGLPFAAASRHA